MAPWTEEDQGRLDPSLGRGARRLPLFHLSLNVSHRIQAAFFLEHSCPKCFPALPAGGDVRRGRTERWLVCEQAAWNTASQWDCLWAGTVGGETGGGQGATSSEVSWNRTQNLRARPRPVWLSRQSVSPRTEGSQVGSSRVQARSQVACGRQPISVSQSECPQTGVAKIWGGQKQTRASAWLCVREPHSCVCFVSMTSQSDTL